MVGLNASKRALKFCEEVIRGVVQRQFMFVYYANNELIVTSFLAGHEGILNKLVLQMIKSSRVM